MNNMGIKALYYMRLRIEGQRYLRDLLAELQSRGMSSRDIYKIMEIFERSTCFLYDLKHKPETYNIPVVERVNQILVISAVSFQVNKPYYKSIVRGEKNYGSFLRKLLRFAKESELEKQYMEMVNQALSDFPDLDFVRI